jgi:hypothetical protein
MTKYIPTQTTNIQLISCVSFVIDGVEIYIYEDYAESQIDIISGWASQIKYKPIFDFKIAAFCDYAEFYIQQINWDTMLVTTQFHDGSDKIEAFCDAKTVYQEIIILTENYLLQVDKNPDLLNAFRRKPNIEILKSDFQILKDFGSSQIFGKCKKRIKC